MKSIVINLVTSLLTFTFGFATASLWDSNHPTTPKVELVGKASIIQADTSASIVALPEATPVHEVVFAGGRLKIVADEVHLKSERLRYKIDLTYPQIVGGDELHIRKLNQHIKALAIEQYQWPLSPSKADLTYYKDKHPEAFNSVYLDYEVRLATDSFLSIYFICYSYGIGAAHSVQYSFVINYDLASRKVLRLGDLFQPRSKYLDFLSQYCSDELSNHGSNLIFDESLAPSAENFESWSVMSDGIRFNFDACEVFGCSGGKQEVDISFAVLKPRLKPNALPF